MLAVDPTSKRSGGALLGDRARIDADPADRGLFIRSTAAGERLGGLAPATRAAAQALAAAFDVVVIETVGVGQSETEVAEAADTVAVVVQPGRGDALQFLKAGIMEIPDVLVVTKADLGEVALALPRDLHAALRSLGERGTAVVAVTRRCRRRRASSDLVDALDEPPRRRSTSPPRAPAPAASARWPTSWPSTASAACARSAGRRAAERWLAEQDPALEQPALLEALEARAALSAEVVIGVDIGTTSTKAVAFTPDGTARAAAQGPRIRSRRPAAGRSRTRTPSRTRRSPRPARRSPAPVRPGSTSPRSRSAPRCTAWSGLDAHGAPLTPLLTWADARAAPQAAALRASGEALELHRRTGTPVHPMSPLLKLRWFAEEEPETAAAAAHWAGIKELVLLRLTGELVCDPGIASGTGLFSLAAEDWDARGARHRARRPRAAPAPGPRRRAGCARPPGCSTRRR